MLALILLGRKLRHGEVGVQGHRAGGRGGILPGSVLTGLHYTDVTRRGPSAGFSGAGGTGVGGMLCLHLGRPSHLQHPPPGRAQSASETTPRSSASSPVHHTHLRKFPRTATAYRVGVVVQDRADPRLACGPSAEDVKVRPPTLWRSRASTVVSRDHDRDCLSNGVSHLMPPPQNKQN